MSIQRWTPFKPDEDDSTYLLGMWVKGDGHFVLWGDHVEALRQVEERGWKQGWDEAQSLLRGRRAWQAYQQGQRDMLAKCITAVDEIAETYPSDSISSLRVLAALRALQEKP